jgi:uncharacterized membrane protein YdjX (TVP38/TMEM64 family)
MSNGSRAQWKSLVLVSAVALCAAIALWSFVSGGLFSVLLSAGLTPDEKLSHLRDFFHSFGHAAPVAYVILVTTEVVIAPIPGTMLYAPGGVIFGGFWGGLLSLIGNVAGAAVSCQLMRILGDSVRNRLIEKPTSADLQARIEQHGILVIFLLRVNPLTSSDLVSYVAGLTRMPVWKLCAGTALGMAPLCWLQAYTADRLLSAFPRLLYPLIGLCGIYAVIVLFVIWRLATTKVKAVTVEHDLSNV